MTIAKHRELLVRLKDDPPVGNPYIVGCNGDWRLYEPTDGADNNRFSYWTLVDCPFQTYDEVIIAAYNYVMARKE